MSAEDEIEQVARALCEAVGVGPNTAILMPPGGRIILGAGGGGETGRFIVTANTIGEAPAWQSLDTVGEVPAWKRKMPQAKAAMLATLDALSEPTEAMVRRGGEGIASCGSQVCAVVNYRDMIAAKRAEIEAVEV